MSQEETKNNFDFERKKHFEFFLPFYKEKNWLVEKDNINNTYRSDWDVKLEIFAGQFVLVDEKALRKEFDNFLIEIVQDMKTGNLGWFFGQKDWILYGSWQDMEKAYPSSLYLVDSKKLKEYINSLEGFIKTCISKRGWGNTWNIVLYWEELINKNVAQKLI